MERYIGDVCVATKHTLLCKAQRARCQSASNPVPRYNRVDKRGEGGGGLGRHRACTLSWLGWKIAR